jgi:hypothetical protein
VQTCQSCKSWFELNCGFLPISTGGIMMRSLLCWHQLAAAEATASLLAVSLCSRGSANTTCLTCVRRTNPRHEATSPLTCPEARQEGQQLLGSQCSPCGHVTSATILNCSCRSCLNRAPENLQAHNRVFRCQLGRSSVTRQRTDLAHLHHLQLISPMTTH